MPAVTLCCQPLSSLASCDPLLPAVTLSCQLLPYVASRYPLSPAVTLSRQQYPLLLAISFLVRYPDILSGQIPSDTRSSLASITMSGPIQVDALSKPAGTTLSYQQNPPLLAIPFLCRYPETSYLASITPSLARYPAIPSLGRYPAIPYLARYPAIPFLVSWHFLLLPDTQQYPILSLIHI